MPLRSRIRHLKRSDVSLYSDSELKLFTESLFLVWEFIWLPNSSESTSKFNNARSSYPPNTYPNLKPIYMYSHGLFVFTLHPYFVAPCRKSAYHKCYYFSFVTWEKSEELAPMKGIWVNFPVVESADDKLVCLWVACVQTFPVPQKKIGRRNTGDVCTQATCGQLTLNLSFSLFTEEEGKMKVLTSGRSNK